MNRLLIIPLIFTSCLATKNIYPGMTIKKFTSNAKFEKLVGIKGDTVSYRTGLDNHTYYYFVDNKLVKVDERKPVDFRFQKDLNIDIK